MNDMTTVLSTKTVRVMIINDANTFLATIQRAQTQHHYFHTCTQIDLKFLFIIQKLPSNHSFLSQSPVILCAHDKMSTKQMHFILVQLHKG